MPHPVRLIFDYNAMCTYYVVYYVIVIFNILTIVNELQIPNSLKYKYV